MAQKQSLEKLELLIEGYSNVEGGMHYRNSFAMACYLAKQEQIMAAKKMLRCLFDVLGWEKNKTYFNKIIESIIEYSDEYLLEISANLEICEAIDALANK